MRLAFVVELPWPPFRNLVHAHSHVAMLGWLYAALYVLIVVFFLPKERQSDKKYNVLYWLTQTSVLGMLVSFPIQGYAAFSISFTVLHVFLSYYFIYSVWKDTRNSERLKDSISFRFLKTGIQKLF